MAARRSAPPLADADADDGEDPAQVSDAVVARLEVGGGQTLSLVLAPHVDGAHAEAAWPAHVRLPGVADEEDVGRVDPERVGALA